MKSPVWARSPGPSPRRVAVQLDSTAVSTTAACPPSCAAMASPTVLRGRTSTAAVSVHLPQSNFSNISKIVSQALPPAPPPLPPPPLLPPPALQQCKLGELVCEASPGCIPLDKRCDRSADCLPFHADESSCHGNVPLRVLSFKIFSIARSAVDDFPALFHQKRQSFGDGLKRALPFRMFILKHRTELSSSVPPRLPALPGPGCCCSLPASLRTSDHFVTPNCQNRLWIFRNESKPHIQPPLGAKYQSGRAERERSIMLL